MADKMPTYDLSKITGRLTVSTHVPLQSLFDLTEASYLIRLKAPEQRVSLSQIFEIEILIRHISKNTIQHIDSPKPSFSRLIVVRFLKIRIESSDLIYLVSDLKILISREQRIIPIPISKNMDRPQFTSIVGLVVEAISG